MQEKNVSSEFYVDIHSNCIYTSQDYRKLKSISWGMKTCSSSFFIENLRRQLYTNNSLHVIQMTHTTIKLDTRNCLKLEGMPEDFVHIKLNSTESHMKKQKADQ